MNSPIVNLDQLEPQPRPPGFAPSGAAAAIYEAKTAPIAPRLGARQLGYNLTEVPPGKRAYPFHSHLANEEMFLILAGSGEVRIGEQRWPLRTGDIVACPAGGPETAHQIINTGTETLRYLAVSTRISPEVAEYPDSGKFGVLATRPAPAGGQPSVLMYLGREGESLPYWDE